jgi:lipoate-protein ligase A
MDWQVIETMPMEAEKIMEKDRRLLEEISLYAQPILHLYEWKGPSVTYGHFIDPAKFFSFEGLAQEEIVPARRPTGGGIIFHLWDFAFSVLIPSSHPSFSQNTLENYAYVNGAVLDAVEEFLQNKEGAELTLQDGDLNGKGSEHFCMAKPTKYDVMIRGKKVAGAAQRKTKEGLLHQGSISLLMPCQKILEKVLLPELMVAKAMQSCTFPLLQEKKDLVYLKNARDTMKQLLCKHITKR